MKIFWSPFARADRTRLIDFIAEDNLEAAVELLDLIEESVANLVNFPHMGRIGKIPTTRELVIHKNYIVVYAVNADMVYIVAVLHASQQWPSP